MCMFKRLLNSSIFLQHYFNTKRRLIQWKRSCVLECLLPYAKVCDGWAAPDLWSMKCNEQESFHNFYHFWFCNINWFWAKEHIIHCGWEGLSNWHLIDVTCLLYNYKICIFILVVFVRWELTIIKLPVL